MYADTWKEDPKAGVENLLPLGLMIIRNYYTVLREAKSYNEIPDKTRKIFSLRIEK